MPRHPLRPVRQRIEAALLHAVGALARALPFQRASDLGAALGHGAYRVLGRRRLIAVENVARTLGPSPLGSTPDALVEKAFAQLGRSFLEFLALPALTPAERLGRVEFEGFEFAEESRREGKGAVLVTGHFGNWELFGAAFVVRYAPVKYLLPRQTNPWSDRYLNEVRRQLGIEPLLIEEDLRAAVRALRAGSYLAMLPDQDARGAGVHVPFFGRPASTHAGPARLAFGENVPIVVGVIERLERGKFRVRKVATLTPDVLRERKSEILRLTAEVTSALEGAIRARPDHWYWIHRRWKTPPPAEALSAAPNLRR
jgi:KDO2-lipid IV(A) lauroyltransferase